MQHEWLTDFRLYLITDRKLFSDTDSFFNAVRAAVEAGVKAVQLREKDLPVREMLALAYRMREITQRHQTKLLVNDRVDIALCAHADGVHLGQSSLPVPAARKVAGGRMIIGVSTHSPEEAEKAEKDGADFITFGPLYETPSKFAYGAPVGIAALRQACRAVSLPVLGIGGITPGRVQEVRDAGARGVAVIRGIFGAPDIPGAVRDYLR